MIELAGKPLIQYTFDAVSNCEHLDRVILSTDSEEIADFGRRSGIEVPFVRPDYLATDQTSTRAVQQHAIQWCQKEEGQTPEALVTLQPTSPFRVGEHIDQAIIRFQDTEADSVLSVTPVREHPYEIVGFSDGHMYRIVERPNDVVRRQQYPLFFKINGAIYITKSEILLNSLSGYGDRVFDYQMDNRSSVDIDTHHDLKIADALIRSIENQANHQPYVNRASKPSPNRPKIVIFPERPISPNSTCAISIEQTRSRMSHTRRFPRGRRN